MHADARVRRDRRHRRRALESDQIDVAARRRERHGVVLHARAAAQISEYDNGGSHVTLYLLLGFSSAALALFLTPVIGRGSTLLGLVDAPGGRKVHTQSVPAAGRPGRRRWPPSLALVLVHGFLSGRRRAPHVAGTAARASSAGCWSFWPASSTTCAASGPAPKLAIELLAAGVVMSSGLLIERITILGTTWTLGWLAFPITAAWLVGVTNAFNLIDGVDGLAPGVAALAGAACGAILIVRGHTPEAMLLAAFVGAMLGFLVYNFEPASIFLGDGGSLVAGFLLASTAIAGWQKGATALAVGGAAADLRAADLADARVDAGAPRAGARPTDGRSIAQRSCGGSSNPIASTSITGCSRWAGRCGGR